MRSGFQRMVRVIVLLPVLLLSACGGGDDHYQPSDFGMTGVEFHDAFYNEAMPFWAPDYVYSEPVSGLEDGEKTLTREIWFSDGSGIPRTVLKTFLTPDDRVKRVQVIMYADPRMAAHDSLAEGRFYTWRRTYGTSVGILAPNAPDADFATMHATIQEKIDNSQLWDTITIGGLVFTLSYDDATDPPVMSVTISY